MPDFERVLRRLELVNEQAKKEIKAYHKGLDRARIEVVLIVSSLFLLHLFLSIIP